MNQKSKNIQDIEEIAQNASCGEDVSEHFTGQFQAKQQVNIALPLELLRNIDAECQRQNINRQDWIKIACAEKVNESQKQETPNNSTTR
ncbi:hypothetical protein PN462_14900 [Spirulina sp. CS-785/01]|uniref:hypothetical protein n=1 Tax=Spirulina sp. CS-785/01 TaxID=3021716 RepID=UPI00232C586D|nr:hypothetical protein [Spirulina sp. CS-785/01]MDB9314398.1 hypothetical protein [Spirulina sp. CS-785/01]